MNMTLKEEKVPSNKIKEHYTPIKAEPKFEKVSYPCDKKLIGDIAEVIQAITNVTKNNTAMVGQAVIGTLAGATQANYQVKYFNHVGLRPLSLFVLTIAKSGQGKSHIAKLCNESLKGIEIRKMKTHRRLMTEYEQTLKAKGDNAPIKPVNPKFIFNTGTTEGIIDVITRNGECYALIDEISILLGGHSTKPENLGKLIGTFSTLWSDGDYSEVKRGDDDPRQVNGDLTLAISGQPTIVKPMFNSPIWRGQGTMNRFLVCEHNAIKQHITEDENINKEDQHAIDSFNATIKRIYEVMAHSEGKYTVTANKEAKKLLTEFYNEMADKENATDSDIRSYFARATEQAGRLAGLLSVYNAFNRDPMHKEGDIIMTKGEALAGISLMRYYIHEYERLSSGDFGACVADEALKLFDEIKSNPDKWQKEEKGYVSQSKYTRSIGRLKNKTKAEAFSILCEHNYLIREESKDSIGRNRTHYRINNSC